MEKVISFTLLFSPGFGLALPQAGYRGV